MDTYKHVNNHTNNTPTTIKKEKEKAPAHVVTKPAMIDTAPKRLSGPTDSSYHIEFPVSPSTLYSFFNIQKIIFFKEN